MAKCSACGRNLGAFSFGKKLCQWCVQHQAQQRGEAKPDEIQRVMPTPWAKSGAQGLGASFHQLIVGVNLLVFLAMVVSGYSLMSGPPPQEMIRWGGNFGPLTLGGQPWRLVTYMFLHYGLLHFGFNMWCLWDLGALAESLYGDWIYVFLYLTSGVGGALLSVWWHPGSVSAGASGAIFGLAGALIASLKLGEFSLPRNAISGVLRSVLLFAGYNLVFGAMWGRTDNACHIGGFVTGLLVGALVAKIAPDRDAVGNRVAICLVVLLVLAAGAYGVNRSRGFTVAVQRGETLLGEGKIDESIVELQRAIRMRPEYAEAHFELAHAYLLKGNIAGEQAELKRILELDPKSEMAAYDLGLSYLNDKQLPQARETFAQMLNQNFHSADAHVGLGLVAAAEHKDEAAVQEFETATRIDEQTDVYYDLGSAYLRLKRYDDAIAALAKHQQLSDADDYDTEMALAEAYRAKGMQQEAGIAAQKANTLKQ